MKCIKSLFIVALVASATLFCSCEEQTSKSYSVDIKLKFDTTKDVSDYTVRQYELYRDGGLITAKTISGPSFSGSEMLTNLTPPTTIEIKVIGNFSGAVVPAQMQVKNSYDVSCTNGSVSASFTKTESERTIKQSEVESFISKELNYTLKCKLNEDGSISKL